jgi:hypothetical protein
VGRPQRNKEPVRVEQLDMKNRRTNLWPGETKSGEGRTIKMTQEAYGFLRECVDGKEPHDAVFTWPDGRAVGNFRGAWAKMAEDAGVSGHKTDSMFERHNITDEHYFTEAAAKLEARRISRKLVTDAQPSDRASVKN